MSLRVAQGLFSLVLGAWVHLNAWAAVNITPPNLAGTLSGSLPGVVDVGPTGAASYNIPLSLPPGTGGVAPSLGLAYQSQAGMNMLGLGWKLAGQSQVTRCGKTLATDNVRRPVKLDAQDPFCLDGQRLLLVSGVHGANAEYRTEVDGFSRIQSFGTDANGGPSTWKVWTKAGQIFTYGSVPGALLTVAAHGRTVNLTWAISRQEDRYSNYIAYHYVEGDGTGEFYITRIRYTGNDAAGKTAMVPYNAVNFIYEDRPDPWQGYVGGAKLQRLKRLVGVNVRINVNADGTGGTLVRQYKIGYGVSPTSGRSLVRSVEDCDGAGVCLPASTFDYSVRAGGANTLAAVGSGDWGGPNLGTLSNNFDQDGYKFQQVRTKAMVVDLNGDGKSDLLHGAAGTWKACLSTGTSFSCSNWAGGPAGVGSGAVVPGDFNADGRTDLVLPGTPGNGSVSDWSLCLSTGSSFSCSTVSGRSYGRLPNRYAVGDFDGDSRDDVMVIGNAPLGESTYLCKSTGTTFSCALYDAALTFFPEGEVPIDKLYRMERNIHDIDGDGRSDVLNFIVENIGGQSLSYYFETWLASDGRFIIGPPAPSAHFAYGPQPGQRQVADSNGDPYDSYADLHTGGRTKNGDPYRKQTCHFTGLAFTCLTEDASEAALSYANDVADYDGDGRLDVLAGSAKLMQLSPSGSRGSPVNWTPPLGTSPLTSGGDFNGDGLADVAYYDEATGHWTISLAGFGGHADLLSKVTNGFGMVSQLQYKPLHDATVYTRGADVAYPKRNVPSGMPVVSTLQVAAGSAVTPGDTWLGAAYTYEGLRTDQRGRGSLGFAKVIESDLVSGTVSTTTYSQDFPHIGQPLTAQSVNNGVTLAQSTYTLKDFATAGGARHSYVRQTVAVRKDLNGASLGTTTTLVGSSAAGTDGIDAYGNVTNATVTVAGADGLTATAAQTDAYSNSATPWIIGRKTRSAVSKTLTGAAAVAARTTAATYNATTGALETETIEPDKVAYKVLTTLVRDAQFGVVTQKKLAWRDPGNVDRTRTIETTTYDDKGRFPATVKNAKSQLSVHAYDAATGTLTSLQDPNGLTTTWTNDAWGRKTRESRPDATATTWHYKTCVDTCASGGVAVAVTIEQQWAKVDGADERTTVPLETFHDKLSRKVMTRTWDAQGNAVYADWIHDHKGKLLKQTTPHTWADRQALRHGTTEVAGRDALGRPTLIKTTRSAGTGTDDTQVTYNGLSTTVVNAKGQSRATAMNVLGKVASTTDTNAKVTRYAYDPFGNLKVSTDPLANQISLTYDDLGRKTQLKDPDLGTWSYKVDALGQTYEQTDAKAQKTSFSFDDLGRLTDRIEPDQQSHWVYDTAANGIGDLAESYTGPSTAKDYRQIHTYDSLGRPERVITRLDWDYAAIHSYDAYGRLMKTIHRRNAVGEAGGTAQQMYYFTYNNQGAVQQLKRGDGTQLLWTRDTQDALGHTVKETFGSGLVTQRQFNAYTGRLEAVDTGTVGSNGVLQPSIQNDQYTYDALGNLETREQLAAMNGALVKDTFTYDALNRLASMKLGTGAARLMAYDDLGNITSKPSVGTYAYPASGASSVRPHAVTGITGTVAGLVNPSFEYDNNGNLKLGLNRGYQWSAANYPTKIDELSNGQLSSAFERTEFTYGPDRQKTRQLVRAMSGQTEGALRRTQYYGGAIEKEVDLEKNKTLIRTYLPLGLGYTQETISGVAVPSSTGVWSTRFFHTDHLGSPTVMTGLDGTESQRMSYDAWGRRRQTSGADDSWASLGTLANTQDHTGYTGQEQLDQVGLVHLNGRVYDPMVGRMLSADPTVPDPSDLQSLNRFSYVQNNALAFVDPTGFNSIPNQEFEHLVLTNNVSVTVTPLGDGSYKVSISFSKVGSKIVRTFEGVVQVAMTSNEAPGSIHASQGLKAASAAKGETGGLRQFASELDPVGLAQQTGRKLLDDFVKNNSADSPNSNAYLRWLAGMVAGSYTPPDSTSANGVAATVTAAAIPFLTGQGETKVAKEALLFRRGPHDTKALLESQAQSAEKVLGVHGVSVSTSPAAKAGQVVRCATCSSVEAAGFKVQRTGNDLNHHTVGLPKPITPEIVRIWNELFK